MKAYQKFATVYEQLMTEIPYEQYVELIELAGANPADHLLDIGCGTGTLARLFAEKGYQVTGFDLSSKMIEQAEQKNENQFIRYRVQAMQELTDQDCYQVVVVAIDSLNYLKTEQEVKETFARIYRALTPNGLFVFDVHSLYKMTEIFLESPFVYDEDDLAYIWQTRPGDEPASIHSQLRFFIRNERGLYERFTEEHYQRTYPIQTYIQWLQEAGFSIERIFADWEDLPPEEESERLFFQVRK